MTQKTEDKSLEPTCRSDGMMMPRGPALLPEESREEYETLRARIAAAVAPADAIEELWAEDVAELTFEIKRLREIRVRIVMAERRDVLEKLVPRFPKAREIASGSPYRELDDNAIKERLAQMKLTPEDVTAKAFERSLAKIDAVNRMVAQASDRRDVVLREIERRREALAARLRAAAAIEDAEFEEVKHPAEVAAVAQVRDGRARR